jgi:Na+-transporting methylmalonyl-CoA/oxaloacetate decarboxylase beta subunit
MTGQTIAFLKALLEQRCGGLPVAFLFGTTSGVVTAKIMNLFLDVPINPLIGSALSRTSPRSFPGTS